MKEIGEENIRVEILRSLEGGKVRIREGGRVLANEAEREFTRELIVPLGTDDVVIKNTRPVREAAQARKQISVIDRQLADRAQGQINLSVARFRQKWSPGHGKAGGIKIRVPAPTNFTIRGYALRKTIEKEKTVMVVGVISIRGQR